ncbi:MAG TPA: GNAT family acetyltransferase [Desulfobacterales bacterium]|nr:GNAT family acetyltransferase [Desulfobacterales bacterium]
MNPIITTFDNRLHRDQVISLWKEIFGYEADHNAPQLVINKKLEFGDGLFFIALNNQAVVGTIMAGYDGHRGWIYSIAVSPNYQKQGIGSSLLAFAERKFSELGCMKINLQIMEGNEVVENFYLANEYQTEKRISMGKRLPENINNTEQNDGADA